MGGPVGAARLLKDAQWAVQTFERTLQTADSLHRQRDLVEQAHLAQLQTTREEFERLVQKQLPRAKDDYRRALQRRTRRNYKSSHEPERPVQPQIQARRRAAAELPGERAHQILAAQPFPEFREVEEYGFEKLTGEKFAEGRSRIVGAARSLADAKQDQRPVLLVLYKSHGSNSYEYDKSTRDLFRKVLQRDPVAGPLRSYTVIKLPLRELAALSQLTEIPNFEVNSRRGPVFILIGRDGKPGKSMSGSVDPQQLASHLWKPVHAMTMSRASNYADRGRYAEAIRLMEGVAKKSGDATQRQQASRRAQELKLALADEWVGRGRATDALKMLGKLKASADLAIRERAEQMISQIRDTL